MECDHLFETPVQIHLHKVTASAAAHAAVRCAHSHRQAALPAEIMEFDTHFLSESHFPLSTAH